MCFLQGEWERNKEPLLRLLEVVQGSVQGLVVDGEGQGVEGRVEVQGRARDTTTTTRGEFWRVLAPGRSRLLTTQSFAKFSSFSTWFPPSSNYFFTTCYPPSPSHCIGTG